MTEEHWHDQHARCLGVLMDGRAQPTGILRSGGDATLLLMLNAGHEGLDFILPKTAQGRDWQFLLDTAELPREHEHSWAFGAAYPLGARVLALFTLRRSED